MQHACCQEIRLQIPESPPITCWSHQHYCHHHSCALCLRRCWTEPPQNSTDCFKRPTYRLGNTLKHTRVPKGTYLHSHSLYTHARALQHLLICINCVIKVILCNQLIKCMPSVILIFAIIVLCMWKRAHPPRLFLPIHRLYPHTTKQEATRPARHNRAQAQNSTIPHQWLPPPPEPPTQLGNKDLQPFVKPLMPPQSQLQNTPFYYLQHTWKLPTLFTPLSRSTPLPSSTCMCQQD